MNAKNMGLKLSILTAVFLICFVSGVSAVPTLSDEVPANGSIIADNRPTFSFTSDENLAFAILELTETGESAINYTMTNSSLTAWSYAIGYPLDLTDDTNYTYRYFLTNSTDNDSVTGEYIFRVELSFFFTVGQTIRDAIVIFTPMTNLIITVVSLVLVLAVIGMALKIIDMIFKLIQKKMRGV